MVQVKYFVKVLGNTLNSDKNFMDLLKAKTSLCDFTKSSVGISDVVIAFVPIVSRAGTDIAAAIKKIPDDKHVIFVVLHHTFDQYYKPPDSRHCVKNDNVFAVDCLFHEDQGLLRCAQNDDAVRAVNDYLIKNICPECDRYDMNSADENKQMLRHRDNADAIKAGKTHQIRGNRSEQSADENKQMLRHRDNADASRDGKTHQIGGKHSEVDFKIYKFILLVAVISMGAGLGILVGTVAGIAVGTVLCNVLIIPMILIWVKYCYLPGVICHLPISSEKVKN